MLHLSIAVLALAFSELVIALPNNQPSSSFISAVTATVYPTTATPNAVTTDLLPVGTGSYLAVTTTITVDCVPSTTTTSSGAAVTTVTGTPTTYASYSTTSAPPVSYSLTSAPPINPSAPPVPVSVSATSAPPIPPSDSPVSVSATSAPPISYSVTSARPTYSVSTVSGPVTWSARSSVLGTPFPTSVTVVDGTSYGIVEPSDVPATWQGGATTVSISDATIIYPSGPFNPTVTITETVCAATGTATTVISISTTSSGAAASASGEALNALSGTNSNSAVGVAAGKGAALTVLSALVAGLVL